jgi:mycofactocin system transcriptional regulator
MNAPRARTQGRPSATDHAAIERAAFRLFQEQGFDETTMEQIADAVGVGRRTLFRYFPSKNDIPWGQFDESLRHFRDQLDAVPLDVPVADAVHRCVVSFNHIDPEVVDQHRLRMRFILTTPTLQAHSAIRYGAWRQVIADYVARRLGVDPESPLPRLVGHVSLAISVSAYERWLRDTTVDLSVALDDAMQSLRSYLS